MPAVEDQITKLERSLRRQRILTVCALALAVLALVPAVTPRGVIRAQSFELVNRDGTVLAQLQPTASGGAFLKMEAPENGGTVLIGALTGDLAGLAVVGREGTALSASTDKNGNPSVSLSQQQRRASLSLLGTGAPTLMMLGRPGTFVATTNYLWLKDPSGKTVLSTVPGGGPPDDAR